MAAKIINSIEMKYYKYCLCFISKHSFVLFLSYFWLYVYCVYDTVYIFINKQKYFTFQEIAEIGRITFVDHTK